MGGGAGYTRLQLSLDDTNSDEQVNVEGKNLSEYAMHTQNLFINRDSVSTSVCVL